MQPCGPKAPPVCLIWIWGVTYRGGSRASGSWSRAGTRCVARSLICSVTALNSRRLPHRASLAAQQAQGLALEDETLLISVSARFLPTAQFCSGGHSPDGGKQRALPCSETTKIPEAPHPPRSQLVRPRGLHVNSPGHLSIRKRQPAKLEGAVELRKAG